MKTITREQYHEAYMLLRAIKNRTAWHLPAKKWRELCDDLNHLNADAVRGAEKALLAREDLTILERQIIRGVGKPWGQHIGRRVAFKDYAVYAAWHERETGHPTAIDETDTLYLYDIGDRTARLWCESTLPFITSEIPRAFLKFPTSDYVGG